MDCHRTWEALLLGSIPIVKTSTLDPLFEDLPVLIVNDWSELMQDFLTTQYEQMSKKLYNTEKIYAQYWIDKIKKVQSDWGKSA